MGELGAYPEKAVNYILEHDADLIAVRPASRNFHLVLPQALKTAGTWPATTYFMVDEVVPITHENNSGPGQARFQVSVWDEDFPRAKRVAELVKGAMQGAKGVKNGVTVQGIFYKGPGTHMKDPDPNLKLYQIPLDFMVHWKL